MQVRNVGFDIGGTKCAMTVGKVDTEIIIEDKRQFATAGKTPQQILGIFGEYLLKQQKKYIIGGVGISCGGPLDSKKGVIMKPPSLPLWDGIEIVKFFKENYGVNAYLQNDANACAVAEWKFGAGKGCDDMVFLTFGTGFGAGLILNGQLYSGFNDNAGEIGHVRMTKTGPVGYNKAGSAEGYCSGSGISRLARMMAEKLEKKGIIPDVVKEFGKDNLTAKLLSERANLGDDFSLKVYKKSGEMLGRVLSIIIDVINPKRIVIGGVYMRSSHLLLPHAEKIIKKEALSFSREVCEILPAGLKENIGDVAALSISNGEF